jgi:PilZ domain
VSGSERRRRHPRFTVEDLQGQLTLASKVDVLNLSLGGVAIKADRRLNIGSQYTLKLEMGDRFIAVQGQVVWAVLSGMRKVRGDDVPEYSAGLKFVDVLTDKVQGLIDFIDENRIVEEHRLAGLRFQVEVTGRAVLDAVESYRVRLISLSGMLIEADRALEVDRVYAMRFQAPGGGDVAFAGRVASCLEDAVGGPRRFRMGIAFVDMSDSDRRRLQSFVKSLTSRTAAR